MVIKMIINMGAITLICATLATFAACQEEGPSNAQVVTLAQQSASPENKTPPQQISTIKNLVECPTKGHKYVDFISLSGDVEKPLSYQQQRKRPLAVQSTYKNELSFSSNGSTLKVLSTKGGKEISCPLNGQIMSMAVADQWPSPVLAVGTERSLVAGYISDITGVNDETVCPKLKVIDNIDHIVSIALAASKDNTFKVEKQPQGEPPPVTLGISKAFRPGSRDIDISLNALPPGQGISPSADAVISDYIYFLSGNNWVGRIKPTMIECGCVEYIWSPPDIITGQIPTSIRIDGDSLVIMADGSEIARIDLAATAR